MTFFRTESLATEKVSLLNGDIKIINSRYRQIAADIASRIADGHYKVGDKIYARSSLAAQYKVSAETARKAIAVLADMQIVDPLKGSGVVIVSCEKAANFVRQYEDIESVNQLKNSIFKGIEQRDRENRILKKQLLSLLDRMDRFKNINPFMPYEAELMEGSPMIGKSLSESNFWHNTGATVVGIRKKDTLIMSPGPYEVMDEGDVLYYVGDKECCERVIGFVERRREWGEV